MLQPGVTIERMFKQVRNTVVERTNSAQVPWESSSLTGGDFYFKPGSTIISNRELVQISDKSLLIEVQLKHHFGTCSIAFKLSDVLI